MVGQNADHPERVAPVDDGILKDCPLRQLFHLAQGIHHNLTRLSGMSRRQLFHLGQIRLAVRKFRQLGEDDEELRHVRGREVRLTVTAEALLGHLPLSHAVPPADEGNKLRGLLGGDHRHLLEHQPPNCSPLLHVQASSQALHAGAVLRIRPCVFFQHRFHFFRLDTHASDLHLTVRATHDLQLAGLPAAPVPCAVEGAVLLGLDPLLCGQLLMLPIASGEHAAETNLSVLARRHRHKRSWALAVGFDVHHVDGDVRLRGPGWSLGREDGQVDAVLGHCVDRAAAL
mmetsp:Transcript_105406/g.263808  ORF Transcript_105406/g.263808 Transcript_105406/m.263808 type:complete len:286 (+) Transcript_105406:1450-2307(+)